MRTILTVLSMLFAFTVQAQQKIETLNITIDELIPFIVDNVPNNSESGIESNIVVLVETKSRLVSREKTFYLKQAFHLLGKRLSENSKVSLISYNVQNGVVLKPTAVSNSNIIQSKIIQFKVKKDNDAYGIDLAYKQANESYKEGGMNKIIFVRDGDNFESGITEQSQPEKKKKGKNAVLITTIGLIPELIAIIKN